jgi:hypothetical protein
MKLSRLSLVLVLIGLVSFLKRQKDLQPNKETSKTKTLIAPIIQPNPAKEAEPVGTVVYTVSVQPSAEDHERSQKETSYWKRQIRTAIYLNWITLIGAGVGGFGLVILWWTLDATRQNFVVAQHARVLLGNKDGKLAEFRLGNKPVVILHFYNAGVTTAIDFAVRTTSNLVAPNDLSEPELNRYLGSYGGRVKNTSQPMGAIPGQSGIVEYLPDRFTPSEEQLTEIKKGKEYRVRGIYIYCDELGLYSAELFSILYAPPPIDDFRRDLTYTPDVSQISEPPKPKMVEGHTFTFTPLPRCEQPGELEELKQNLKKK